MNSIRKHVGDLLSVEHGVIVHGCNAQGVMGSGVAAQVKAKFPGAFALYRKVYEMGALKLGTISVFEAANTSEGRARLLIVNAVTQDRYGTDRRHADYGAIHRCFEHVAQTARSYQLTEVHFPLIGCGLAGGQWEIVAPLIETTLKEFSKHLWVPPQR